MTVGRLSERRDGCRTRRRVRLSPSAGYAHVCVCTAGRRTVATATRERNGTRHRAHRNAPHGLDGRKPVRTAGTPRRAVAARLARTRRQTIRTAGRLPNPSARLPRRLDRRRAMLMYAYAMLMYAYAMQRRKYKYKYNTTIILPEPNPKHAHTRARAHARGGGFGFVSVSAFCQMPVFGFGILSNACFRFRLRLWRGTVGRSPRERRGRSERGEPVTVPNLSPSADYPNPSPCRRRHGFRTRDGCPVGRSDAGRFSKPYGNLTKSGARERHGARRLFFNPSKPFKMPPF